MKTLLRKIFFWDTPAQGAFFALTLLILTAWLLFSLVAGIFTVNVFLLDSPIFCRSLLAGVLAVLFYIAFLTIRMVWKHFLRSWRFWKRLLILLAAVPVVLLFDYAYADDHIIAFCCLLLGMAYPLHPDAKWWKTLLCKASAVCGIYILGCIWGYLRSPFIVIDKLGSSSEPCLAIVLPIDSFRPILEHGFCFALVATILLAAAYLAYGGVMADFSRQPLRRMFTRGIRIQWGIFAAVYVVTLSLALWNTAGYHKAVKELEAHFGRPMTVEAVGKLYYEGRTPDDEFWKKVNEAVEADADNNDNDARKFDAHPFGIMPDEFYARFRKNISGNSTFETLEEMFNATIPPPLHNFTENTVLNSMEHWEYSAMRHFERMALRRIRIAIDDGDFNAAAKAISCMDNCNDFLHRDDMWLSYLVRLSMVAMQFECYQKLLKSGLPTEDWLLERKEHLAQWEAQFNQQAKLIIYGEAVAELQLLNVLCKEPNLLEPIAKSMPFYPLRFFMPQIWWFWGKNAKGLATRFRADSFAQFPTECTGNLFFDFFSGGNLASIDKRLLQATAQCRILRCLIDAEMQKRRTGAYPDTMETLTDPFTNQPLKFRKGPCVVDEYVYEQIKNPYGLEQEDEEEEQEDEDAEPYFDFVEHERTLNAIQIWSVGPDKIDDGGMEAADGQRKDDIRGLLFY